MGMRREDKELRERIRRAMRSNDYKPTAADYWASFLWMLPTILFILVVGGFAAIFMILVGTGR